MRDESKERPASAVEADESTDAATGEVRDADGLLVDEYSDESLDDNDSLDALDVTSVVLDETALAGLSSQADGTSERESGVGQVVVDTVDTGARSEGTDDGEVAIGAEVSSVDELARLSIGQRRDGELRGTREGERHGEQLLDSPDDD